MLPKDLPEPASPCLSCSQGSPVMNRAVTLQSRSSALWVQHWAGGKALGVRAGSFRPRWCDPICLPRLFVTLCELLCPLSLFIIGFTDLFYDKQPFVRFFSKYILS